MLGQQQLEQIHENVQQNYSNLNNSNNNNRQPTLNKTCNNGHERTFENSENANSLIISSSSLSTSSSTSSSSANNNNNNIKT